MSREHLQKQCLGFLNTPPLWYNQQFGIQQFELPKIDMNSFQPQAIPAKIRLGHQMEFVFKQLIQHSDDYAIVLHNLPVKSGKRTIGEIDFIVREVPTGELIHIELTYKFYLINAEISEPLYRIMGPNMRDMFFAKMEKIKNKQFELLHSKEGIKVLFNKNIDTSNILQKACFKAQLFKPYASTAIHLKPLNSNCIYGYWLRFEEFNSHEFKGHLFYMPYKSQWVIEPHAEVEWTSHFKILKEIHVRLLEEYAPMIWVMKSETEFEKLFVVWW